MASSLLALLDDIATILDDVSVMTKVAAKKTAGVLGDDLALNAQQVSGVRADRELPVVWAVAKGSMVNKAILVPAALLISAFAPWAVVPLLMAGGLFLCYEGVEKLVHKMLHGKAEVEAHRADLARALTDPSADFKALEHDKIKGAVRTDFVLSAEIVTIALGTVAAAPFVTQVSVLTGIAALMTVGVYGLVAAIVKIDDAGLYLSSGHGGGAWGAIRRGIGRGILRAAPVLMKLLSVAGTAAMFLVGGGILTHGVPGAHAWIERLTHGLGTAAASIPWAGASLEFVTPLLADALFGIAAGLLALAVVSIGKRLFGRASA